MGMVPAATKGAPVSTFHSRSRLRSTALLAGFSVLLLLGPGAGAYAQTVPGQDPADEEAREPVELSTLTFNAWHGMSMVPDGVEATAGLIEEAGADVVFLQEIDGRSDEVAELLGFHSYDLGGSAGIVSRHEIAETDVVEVPGAQGGWVKAVVEVGDAEVVAYSGHLEYRSYANYMPRGYGGEALGEQWPEPWRSWDRLDEPITDVETLLEVNAASGRPEAAAALVADVAVEQEAGRIALIGGDFNEASALDWTEEAAELFDRNGTAVPWQTTATLQEGGLVDTYRSAFPDPVTHPGFTFPSDNLFNEPEEISWAPEVDERDRIDYIFYLPDEQLTLESVRMVGPQTSILEAERIEDGTEDPIFTPESSWPSDHRSVQADFVICGPACQQAGEEDAGEPEEPDESETPEETPTAPPIEDETPEQDPVETPDASPSEDGSPGREPSEQEGTDELEEKPAPSAGVETAEDEAAEEEASDSAEEGTPSAQDEGDLASTGMNTGLIALGAVALTALLGGAAAVVISRRRA